MDRVQLESIGRQLAERHTDATAPQPERSLLNYAEMSRVGDWSMRSALTRFAQPEAARAGELWELMRRLDVVLHHVARPLERHTVTCDRALDLGASPVDPYPDTRIADLARAERSEPGGFATVLAAYSAASADPLGREEQTALPLLGVALSFDALADLLTRWAARGPEDPPVDTVDETCAIARARLNELGVPVEQRPPGRRRGAPRG